MTYSHLQAGGWDKKLTCEKKKKKKKKKDMTYCQIFDMNATVGIVINR
jgi:hypothetical protein